MKEITLREYLKNFSDDAIVDICDASDDWNIYIEYTSVSQVERRLTAEHITDILDGIVKECHASSELDSFFIYISVAPHAMSLDDEM